MTEPRYYMACLDLRGRDCLGKGAGRLVTVRVRPKSLERHLDLGRGLADGGADAVLHLPRRRVAAETEAHVRDELRVDGPRHHQFHHAERPVGDRSEDWIPWRSIRFLFDLA